nr:MAG TPA: hypothetical protein [Crassvirales sp.]
MTQTLGLEVNRMKLSKITYGFQVVSQFLLYQLHIR